LSLGLNQDETEDAPRQVPSPDEQPAESWGLARLGQLVGGKYRIVRFLAQGGMGLVYEAQHEVLKRRFAVKFLRPDFAQRRENLGRFQREAEAAGGLESEHIASVIDFGITNDGSPYIVMEYLVGESLASLLEREQRLPASRGTDLCLQACHGAETAHAAGIVHRDLKPHNLFLCRRDDGSDLLKVLDFGIAKVGLIKHDQVSTQTGAVLGTPAYMSPEQARGEKSVGLRTDVYSLGAILFEVLSGKLPHPGDSHNAVLYHISTQSAVPLATAAPDIPHSLAKVVDRALASNPELRPPSAKAFAAELARFSRREVWPEPPSLKTAPFPETSLASSESATPAHAGIGHATTVVPARRELRWIVAAVLAGAAVLIAVIWGLSARPPTNQPSPSKPQVVVEAEPSQRTDVVAAPPLGKDVEMPAQGPLPKPVPTAGRRSGGLSGGLSGRPAGRSAMTSADHDRDSPGPKEPVESPKAAKGLFPRASFDSTNPYLSP
jgi:eukaryotic-like serine/threonine-protein kinase